MSASAGTSCCFFSSADRSTSYLRAACVLTDDLQVPINLVVVNHKGGDAVLGEVVGAVDLAHAGGSAVCELDALGVVDVLESVARRGRGGKERGAVGGKRELVNITFLSAESARDEWTSDFLSMGIVEQGLGCHSVFPAHSHHIY